MENENEKFRKLFESSVPTLSSRKDFLRRIERSIDAVETVTLNRKEMVKRNKGIALISGAVGFACGVILTLFYPFTLSVIESMLVTLIQISSRREIISMAGSCSIIAAGSLAGALGSYFFLSSRPGVFRFLKFK